MVKVDHKNSIDGLEMDQRSLRKDHEYILDKVKTIEESLPLMLREMIDYYIDKQLKDTLDQFVKK